MKTAISIPDPIFERADALARKLRISRSELYAQAVLRLVEDHDEAATRAALDEIYGTEASTLPLGAVTAQAAVVSEWED